MHASSFPPSSLNSVLDEPIRQEFLHLSLGGGLGVREYLGPESSEPVGAGQLELRGWAAAGRLGWPGALASGNWVCGKCCGCGQTAEDAKQGQRVGTSKEKKTASEKKASQRENKFREQEATDQKREATRMEKEVKPRQKWDIQPQAEAVFALFSFHDISVDLRWICYLNWVEALFFFVCLFVFSEQHDSINKEFWEYIEKTD